MNNSDCTLPVETVKPPAPGNSANDFVGRFLRTLAVFSAIALLVLVFGAGFMLGVGRWLVKQDSLQKANAIAVLSGNFPARALEAADLYRQGYAKEIWLTNPGPDLQTLKSLGIHYPGEADFNIQVLRRQGVPAKAIHVLDGPIVNTADELDVISNALQKNGSRSVIVVTNKAHTRRVHTLWTRFDATRGQVIVHGLTSDDFDPNGWWRSTEDTHQVIHEMMGMVNVWAGLPMRSRLREQPSLAEINPKRNDPLPEPTASSADPLEQE